MEKRPYRNEALISLRAAVAECYRGSASVRAVLLALLDLGAGVAPNGATRETPEAEREHQLGATWGASVRTLAERAGVTRSTAQRALDELQAGRYIVRVLDRGRQSTVYGAGPELFRVGISDFGTDNNKNSLVICPKIGESAATLKLSVPKSDRWPAHLLTPEHERLYRELDRQPVTVAALAAAVSCKWDTAKARLDALAAVNLAAVTPAGWVRGPGSVTEAAGLAGADERRERQAAQHRREREAHRSRITPDDVLDEVRRRIADGPYPVEEPGYSDSAGEGAAIIVPAGRSRDFAAAFLKLAIAHPGDWLPAGKR